MAFVDENMLGIQPRGALPVAHDAEVREIDEIAGVKLVVIVDVHGAPVAITAVVGEPQAVQVVVPGSRREVRARAADQILEVATELLRPGWLRIVGRGLRR